MFRRLFGTPGRGGNDEAGEQWRAHAAFPPGFPAEVFPVTCSQRHHEALLRGWAAACPRCSRAGWADALGFPGSPGTTGSPSGTTGWCGTAPTTVLGSRSPSVVVLPVPVYSSEKMEIQISRWDRQPPTWSPRKPRRTLPAVLSSGAAGTAAVLPVTMCEKGRPAREAPLGPGAPGFRRGPVVGRAVPQSRPRPRGPQAPPGSDRPRTAPRLGHRDTASRHKPRCQRKRAAWPTPRVCKAL